MVMYLLQRWRSGGRAPEVGWLGARRPSAWSPLSTRCHQSLESLQVGGHSPLFCLDPVTVCKPWEEREHSFYSTLPAALRAFTPAYRGDMQVPTGHVLTLGPAGGYHGGPGGLHHPQGLPAGGLHQEAGACTCTCT